MQKELEKRSKFENLDNDTQNPKSGLENFNIDKSSEN